MKLQAIILFTLSLTLALIPTAAHAQEVQKIQPSRKGPGVHLADRTQDFGRVLIGDVLRHSFIITNVGTEPIKINKIEHSCGCTSAGYDKEILPGKTGKVSFVLNTQGLDGEVHKSATIFSNDPKNPKIEVDLLCVVWSEVTVVPDFAVFNPSEAKQGKRVIRITNQIKKPLVLSMLKCPDKRFKTSLVEVEKGKIYELTITTNPSQLKVMSQASISFNTNCERTPHVSIPVLVIPLEQPVVNDEKSE